VTPVRDVRPLVSAVALWAGWLLLLFAATAVYVFGVVELSAFRYMGF
jgi:hypothetical protein